MDYWDPDILGLDIGPKPPNKMPYFCDVWAEFTVEVYI